MDNNKSCPSYYPMEPCSGNGVCDTTTGLCICKPGWTAIGDFSITPGASCSLYIPTIRILNGVIILFPLLLITTICRYYWSRYSKWNITKVPLTDPVMIFPIFLLFTGISYFIYIICKIIDPEYYSIGIHPYITGNFFFMCFGNFAGIFVYVEVLLRFLIIQAKIMNADARERTRKHADWIKRGVRSLHLVIIVVFALPCLILSHPETIDVVSTIFFVGLSLISVILTIFLLSPIQIIIREIDDHLKSFPLNSTQSDQHMKALQELKKKMEKAKMAIINLVPPPIVNFLILGVWKFTTRNVSYVLPIIGIAANIISIPMILTVSSQGSSSSETSATQSSKNNAIAPHAATIKNASEHDSKPINISNSPESNHHDQSHSHVDDTKANDKIKVMPTQD